MTAQPINYRPSPAGLDFGTYDHRLIDGFRDDQVTSANVNDLPRLVSSPNWEDRVRAEQLRERLTITLPDQFPCIYETVDSPSQGFRGRPEPHAKPFAWVVSADVAMLEAVFEDYQLLWDSYTSQWGPNSRRVMTIGRLDGLSTHNVCRPGTTPAQVIAAAMITHDMYGRAPERLKAMHPRHAGWVKWAEAEKQRIAALYADASEKNLTKE